MKFLSRFSLMRRYSLALYTLIAILGCFLAYYYIYLGQREEALDARNFRSLERFAGNISKKHESFRQMAVNYCASLDARWDSLSNTPDSATAKKARSQTTGAKVMAAEDVKNDSVQHFAALTKSYLKLDSIFRHSGIVGFDEMHFLGIQPADKQVEDFETGYSPDQRALQLKFPVMGKHGVGLVFGVNVQNWVNKIFLDNFFENYLLIDSSGTIISEYIASALELGSKDSLYKSSGGFLGHTERLVNLEGKRYRVFSMPVRIENSKSFLLCGLVNDEKFQREKRLMSEINLAYLCLLLFLVLLGFPFLKSLLLGNSERLNTGDVLLSLVSVCIAGGIFVYLVLDFQVLKQATSQHEKQQVADLGAELSRNFKAELDSINKSLREYGKRVRHRKPGFDRSDSTCNFLNGLPYPFFENIYSINDSTGEQRQKSGRPGKKGVIADLYTIKTRRYVTMLRDSLGWYDSTRLFQFYAEPVNSWLDGAFRFGVSLHNNNETASDTTGLKKTVRPKFYALITKMHSLVDVAIPEGFGFALIDARGEVWAHSDQRKNLNENFIAECDESPELRSAIAAGQELDFESNYSGNLYRMNIRQVKGLPVYLVAFHDRIFSDTQSLNVMGYSSFHSSILIVLGMLVMLMLGVAAWRRSKLRIPYVQIAHLAPNRQMIPLYKKAIAYNLFLLLAYALFFLYHSGSLYRLFLAGYMVIVGIIINAILLSPNKGLLFSRQRRWALAVFSVIVLTLLNISISTDPKFVAMLIYEAVLIAGGVLVYFLPVPKNSIKRNHSPVPVFVCMMMSWLLFINIVPVIGWFSSGYYQERMLHVKHAQLTMAQALTDRLKGEDALLKLDARGIHRYDLHFLDQSSFALKKATRIPEPAQLAYNDDYSEWFRLRPKFNDIVTTSNMLRANTGSSQWYWTNQRDLLLELHYHPLFLKDKELTITTHLTNVSLGKMLRNDTWFCTWIMICLAGVLVAIYFFIRFFIKRIFVIDMISGDKLMELNRQFYETNAGFNRLFVIGAKGAGKKAYFSANTKDALFADLSDAADEEKWETKKAELLSKAATAGTLILQQFEFDSFSKAVNLRKLELLEDLEHFPMSKVIVIATLHPQVLVSRILDDPTQRDAYEIRDRWSSVLGNYGKVYFPLQNTLPDTAGDSFIEAECRFGEFLPTLLPQLEPFKNLSIEEITLKIQSLSGTYYHSVWSSLSASEQFVLFDIAQDGLVNFRNIDVILQLLNKGLLVYDERIRVMNLSFRNFIICTMTPEDLAAIEKQNGSSGGWSLFKTPLLMLAAGVLIFLVRTQDEGLGNSFTYITSLGSGALVALQLIGSFSKVSSVAKTIGTGG